MAGNLPVEGKHGAYYDAKIGRFLQQDSMAFPNQIQGMNRMMYVEGNPVGFRDPSGNNKYIHMFNQIAKHMIGGFKIADKAFKSIAKGSDSALRKAGRGIDGAVRHFSSGGKYSRNKLNTIDKIGQYGIQILATYFGIKIFGAIAIALAGIGLLATPLTGLVAIGGGFLGYRIAKGYSTSSFRSGLDWQKSNDAYYDGDLPNSDIGEMVTRNREFLYYGSLGYALGFAIAFTAVAIILPLLGLTGIAAYLAGIGGLLIIIGTAIVFSALALIERCNTVKRGCRL